MEDLDLEHVPPDLVKNFLENQILVSASISVELDHVIVAENIVDGVDLPGKTNGVKDYSTAVVGVKQKMEVETTIGSSEVKYSSQTEINDDSMDNMEVYGSNLGGLPTIDVSIGNSEIVGSMSIGVNDRTKDVDSYILNSEQHIKNIIKEFESKAGCNKQFSSTLNKDEKGGKQDLSSQMLDPRTNLISPVTSVIDQKSIVESVISKPVVNSVSESVASINIGASAQGDQSSSQRSKSDKHLVVPTINVDANIPFILSIVQRPKSGLKTASLGGSAGGLENNGGTYLSSVENIQPGGKIPDVVMTENVEKVSPDKVVPEIKKVENVWNAKGVTLADKIRGGGFCRKELA
ncbi:hypothetical protein L6452_02620 [Arctium lappa]|uniref:Uncharacterized protein n=1 Tax=Arctium lappa TaxID=4217 RepID=A0ACB9FKG0_ARCLA|nr:hypothetical protein L6452_02620 [Arctium lappa]